MHMASKVNNNMSVGDEMNTQMRSSGMKMFFHSGYTETVLFLEVKLDKVG